MTGFIVPSNLKYAPYVNYYIDIYNKNKIDFEIISWDKKDLKEDVDYAYHYKANDGNRLRMLWGYVKYISFVKSICKKRKYDRLVVFTVAPAAFMMPFLTRKYNKNYILDIRDDSPFVHKTPYIFNKVRDAASSIVYSSPLFVEWIGKEGYICHNCDSEILKIHRNDVLQHDSGLPTKIVFAGMMIETAINVQFVENVAEDNVLEFSYWGPISDGMKLIQLKAKEHGINNIYFGGVYNKADIIDIYRENADFVNIIRKKSTVNRNALPNKLYDAVVSGKPVIVFSHNEAVAQYVEKYNLGIILEEEDMTSIKGTIQKKISEFSFEEYNKGRISFINVILKEQKAFETMVRQFEKI